MVFPTNTTGLQLDALARQSLWALVRPHLHFTFLIQFKGLDYRHGTGHGVGHFLNVHEGPHGISFRIGSHSSPLQAGMTVTNGTTPPFFPLTRATEPGYYEDGHFGIRIENQLIVTNVKTQFNFNQTQFLGFETTTFVRFQQPIFVLLTVPGSFG